jgi:hypothetical protein
MRASLAIEAISTAHRRGLVAGNAIMHTDRGSQYHSEDLSGCIATSGDPAEHQPYRLVSRRRGGRVLLRHDQVRDRSRLVCPGRVDCLRHPLQHVV